MLAGWDTTVASPDTDVLQRLKEGEQRPEAHDIAVRLSNLSMSWFSVRTSPFTHRTCPSRNLLAPGKIDAILKQKSNASGHRLLGGPWTVPRIVPVVI
jgi:hypothetical protein